MRKYKIVIFILVILLLCTSGCTAYVEINDLPLILGASIDKSEDGKYLLTIEVFTPTAPSKEKKSEITTKIVQSEGETIFDAIRNLIAKLGKRGYWTHLKVLIISKAIAEEGISSVLDKFYRSAQLRKEFPVIISRGETAYEILYNGKQDLKEPVSVFLNNTIKSVNSISKYDYIKFYELIDDISDVGYNAVLPLVSLNDTTKTEIPTVSGLAVFEKDKMIGTLDTNQTKALRLMRNEEKGGIIVIEWNEEKGEEKVSLEILKSNTKLEPLYNNKEISFNIKITTTVEIAEIMNPKIDVLSEVGRIKLKKEAENKIKLNIENLLNKLQQEYGSDVIGFGRKIKEKYPSVWKANMGNWASTFANISANIKVDVKIKGTATRSEELKIGE